MVEEVEEGEEGGNRKTDGVDSRKVKGRRSGIPKYLQRQVKGGSYHHQVPWYGEEGEEDEEEGE